MSDRIFLDSNILIYFYTGSDSEKQAIARALAMRSNAWISTQVINETVNVLYRKYGIPWKTINNVLADLEANFFVHTVTTVTIESACALASTYKFSYFDSLIIASAIEAGCSTIYTEDLHHLQQVGGTKVINPFLLQ